MYYTAKNVEFGIFEAYVNDNQTGMGKSTKGLWYQW